jgi:hypothetical protein
MDPGDALHLAQMGAQLLVCAVVRSLRQQMEVEVAQQ